MYMYFKTNVAAAAQSAAMEAVNHFKNSAIVDFSHEWHEPQRARRSQLSRIGYVYISVN